MANYNLKICAKGSRKTGREFIKATNYLSKIVGWIEIDFNYPHDNGFDKEIKFLKDLQKRKGINYTIHAPFLSGNLNDLNEIIRKETIKQIFRTIDRAVELKAKIVVLHFALGTFALTTKKREELELDSLKKIAIYAKKKKIKIGLENDAQTSSMFADRTCKFEMIYKTVKKVGHKNFGMTIDIGHANISGENYIKALKTYRDKIFHIHAHDNLGKAENNIKKFNRPDPHLPIGRGNIKWKEVLKILKQINYQGCFTLECEIKDMEKSIDYLEKL